MFEEFSVGCDGSQLWYHYVCVGLSGQEPQLQEGSELPYFCPKCTENKSKSGESSNTVQKLSLKQVKVKETRALISDSCNL